MKGRKTISYYTCISAFLLFLLTGISCNLFASIPLEYFRENLDIYEEERKDPPFFVLKTLDSLGNRDVYVLGSRHDIHPELLLSTPIYEHVRRLLNEAIVFTEHPPIAWSLIEKHELFNPERRCLLLEEEDQWLVHDLGEEQMEMWSQISASGEKFPGTEFPMHAITKLPQADGIMLFFGCWALKREEIYCGFEFSLRGTGIQINYLETIEELINIQSSSFEETYESYFKGALINMKECRNYEEHREEVEFLEYLLDKHKRAITSHSHDLYIYRQENRDTVLKRNELWGRKIENFLQENTSSQPVFIICGAAHLSGRTVEDNRSFLNEIWNRKLFQSISRINKLGEEVDTIITKFSSDLFNSEDFASY